MGMYCLFWATFFSLYAGNFLEAESLPAKVIRKRQQSDKTQSHCCLSYVPMGDHHHHPEHPCHVVAAVALSLPLPFFVLKICNFVTDVGETNWKYSKQRGFGAFFGVYKVTLQFVTKSDFCKQREVCKHLILTGFCRKMPLFTNNSEPNFCNRSCQHLQSDWFTKI